MSGLSKSFFHNEEAAFAHLEGILWPVAPICPHCGSINAKHYDLRKTRIGLRKCCEKACRKQFTIRVGTVFESAHIPLHKTLQAVYLIWASKRGVSAHQIHRILGVTYKTAWFLCHRIREALRAGDLPPMGGVGSIVEIDETVYQHCSEKHLHRYIAEFDCRYSSRSKLGIEDQERAYSALVGISGKRLTYQTAGR
jgi:transposase-like protein